MVVADIMLEAVEILSALVVVGVIVVAAAVVAVSNDVCTFF